MDTFPIVSRKDRATYGEYRTKRVILDFLDTMQESLTAKERIWIRPDTQSSDTIGRNPT